jgi:hypothetical protein
VITEIVIWGFQLLAQAAPAAPSSDVTGMAALLTAASGAGFALFFGVYVLFFGIPKMTKTIETITANCEAAATKKDEQHAQERKELMGQVKDMGDSFLAELKEERADRKEMALEHSKEIALHRDRAHDARNDLAKQSLEVTAALHELTAVIRGRKDS